MRSLNWLGVKGADSARNSLSRPAEAQRIRPVEGADHSELDCLSAKLLLVNDTPWPRHVFSVPKMAIDLSMDRIRCINMSLAEITDRGEALLEKQIVDPPPCGSGLPAEKSS